MPFSDSPISSTWSAPSPPPSCCSTASSTTKPVSPPTCAPSSAKRKWWTTSATPPSGSAAPPLEEGPERAVGAHRSAQPDRRQQRQRLLGATIEAFPIVFLGNVDAKVESSARFRLPSGEQFLKIAQEYRNPENFIRTALVPAIKETLQATASLMTADDFYAGARSEFAAEFENQLNDGLYLIKRKEVRGPRGHVPQQTAILQAGTEQGTFGDNNASQFVTEKVIDAKGMPVRKQQQFRKYGVEVVEARITNVDPNPQYKQRMVKVQQALAELAVARQNRLKEEEEKLLVTARGEKEVEARRQETLRDQIERTTQAETEKQLARINAEREKGRAEIEKQTAELLRDKASITAQATKITADAEAYAREAVIKADGALQQARRADRHQQGLGRGRRPGAGPQRDDGCRAERRQQSPGRDRPVDGRARHQGRPRPGTGPESEGLSPPRPQKRPSGRFSVPAGLRPAHRCGSGTPRPGSRSAHAPPPSPSRSPHPRPPPRRTGRPASGSPGSGAPRFQQAEVELAQLFVQMRHQGFETLAGARLDEGPTTRVSTSLAGSWLRTTLRRPEA